MEPGGDRGFWNGQPWYFQYDAQGQPGGDLNKADAGGVYKAMDRASVIRTFNHDVVEMLRSSATAPVNISHVFYYSYDSRLAVAEMRGRQIQLADEPSSTSFCIDGMIDPSTADLLPGIAAAVAGADR